MGIQLIFDCHVCGKKLDTVTGNYQVIGQLHFCWNLKDVKGGCLEYFRQSQRKKQVEDRARRNINTETF